MANLPEKKFVASPVAATIWKNKGQDEKTYRTISIERRYKDKEGKWQSTNSVRVGDLPKVQYVVSKAYEYILENPDDNYGEPNDRPKVSEEVVM